MNTFKHKDKGSKDRQTTSRSKKVELFNVQNDLQ